MRLCRKFVHSECRKTLPIGDHQIVFGSAGLAKIISQHSHSENIIEMENVMEDARCCGTGTCIINADGECWCGQRWNGTHMSYPDAVLDKTTADTSQSEGASSPMRNSESEK
jgi:hypothetical protein